jgi:hypothetical protein
MGMTYGVCHVPSYLPAGVPGVSTARRQEDWLRLEDRLCQQPAGNSTEERQSRAMKTKAHQRMFHRKWAGPRQKRQRPRMGVTSATTGLGQSAIEDPSPR